MLKYNKLIIIIGEWVDEMKLNMKKLLPIVAFGLVSAFTLTGCGITEMTDSQERIIAEYAADVLIHYDASYYDMFAEEPKIKDETQNVAEADEKEEEKTAAPKPQAPTSEPTSTPEPTASPEELTGEAVTGNVVQQDVTPLDVGNIFGLDKMEISFKDLKIVDKYPDVADNQLAFQVTATSGHRLMVLTFDILNVADVASNCNIIGQNIKFRVCVNDTDYLSVQKTLLADDFAQMNVTLQPHENKTGVVVCQVPSDYNTDVTSLSLVVRTGGEDKIVKLK